MQKDSIGGSKYFLLLKNDYSHHRTVYFIRHKNEVEDIIENYTRTVKTDTGNKVNAFRTDDGLEFVNYDVKSIIC